MKWPIIYFELSHNNAESFVLRELIQQFMDNIVYTSVKCCVKAETTFEKIIP